MNYQKTFRLILGLTVFLAVSLACSLFSRVTENVEEAEQTAQAGIQGGQGLLETGQALATDMQGSGLAETAVAMATQIDESGLAATVQAAATEFDDSGVLQTAQAAITEQGPSVQETAQAVATELSSSMGEAPEDVPIMEGEKTNLFTSSLAISYFIDVPFRDALDYYETMMPENGWTRVDQGSVTTQDAAVIYFEKDGRQAIVTLSINPVNEQTVVLITLQGG
jgi:hypothetical protein